MELRPYQIEAVSAVERELSTRRSTLICLATGCGKTICFATIAKNEVRRGGRVLILAHRGELLGQAIDKLEQATGIQAGLEKAEATSEVEAWDEMPYTVVVGSVQSMCKPKRLERFSPNEFSLIIIDECHHALSATYKAVIQHFPQSKILGVTATPDRGDLRSLAEIFETVCFEYNICQAIKEKYLVPIAVQTVPLKIDLTNVSKTAGDYQCAGIGSALAPYLKQICIEIKNRCANRKTIVFTPLIATSRHMLEHFQALGMENVKEVNGDSPDRKEITEWFATAPKGSVLLNSMLLTEGYDEPSVDCIVVLRATKVRSLFVQMLGRGTRLCEGKHNLLVLDFLWLTAQHDLCRPACLLTENEEVAETFTKRQEEKTGGEVLLDAETIEQAETETVKKREDALAERLRKQRHKRATLIDPIAYASKLGVTNLAKKPDESDKPTMQQLEILEKMGVACPLTGTDATAVIERIEDRDAAGLATVKQIRMLEGRGFQRVDLWTAAQARKMTARLAINGWRIPHNINPETYIP